MIKRTITKFETVAEIYGRDKSGKLTANEVARFEWFGGSKANDGQARKAYALQFGKPLRKGVHLVHYVKSCEVWGMETSEFMAHARKLNDKEISEASEE